ncbi:MAG TPA: J domain-containing protein [Caulobacteraceae bacterium]
MTIDPYAVLGVPRDATAEAIKAAYRTKAKSQHPDGGGSPEAFQALGLAHHVLSDPDKRRHYDETGSIDDAVDRTRATALQMIHGVLGGLLVMENAAFIDLVQEMRSQIGGQLRDMWDRRAKAERGIARAAALRKRFSAKAGADLIGELIEAEIEGARDGVKQVGAQIEVAEVALQILADANFAVEPMPGYARPTTSIYQSGLGGVLGSSALGGR